MAYGLATEKSADNFDIGAGEYSFKNFDTDINPNGVYFSLGNCSAATLAWEINKIKKYDATRGTKELVAEAETQRGATLTITMDESDPIKYALAMFGQTSIKEIAETNINEVYTVSPGDEIFIMLDDGSTAAYNYENLRIDYLHASASAVGEPRLDSQGGVTPSSGTISASGSYTGASDDTFYVKIQKANTVQGTVTDAEFVWKKGLAGVYSAPVQVTAAKQSLSDGVSVKFSAGTAGQDFVVGDEWSISATAANSSLVIGRDYSADAVDVKNGKVRFPADAPIGFNTQVIVRCRVPRQYIPRVYAGIQKKIEGELRFEYDPTHGRSKSYTFYHVSISPNGDDNMITEEWGSRQIQATVLANRSKADPSNTESVYYRIDYPGNVKGVLENRA